MREDRELEEIEECTPIQKKILELWDAPVKRASKKEHDKMIKERGEM